jgi:hypothetical protein
MGGECLDVNSLRLSLQARYNLWNNYDKLLKGFKVVIGDVKCNKCSVKLMLLVQPQS